MADTARRRSRRRHEKYGQLIEAAQKRRRSRSPSCIPATSLACAARSRRRGCADRADPGRAARSGIRQTRPNEVGLDIAGVEIVDVGAQPRCGRKGGRAGARGRAEALMKGSLHTDELMARGGRARRPASAPRGGSAIASSWTCRPADPLIITDAAVNIAPTLEDKVDIVQNAIDLAHALGIRTVRVAILSAMETVDAEGSLDDRSRGPVQDGRARPDHRRRARRAAGARQRDQPGGGGDQAHRLAGRRATPTCWWCPTSRPATCWPRACHFWPRADAAGIVLGARVPIILTSRANSVLSRLASCAVAVMVVAARRKAAARLQFAEGNRSMRRQRAQADSHRTKGAGDRHRERRFDRLRMRKGVSRSGAELAITWLNEKARPHVEPLARELGASITGAVDVTVPGQLEAMFDQIRSKWGRLDILVHSIAFAPKADLQGGILNCSAEGFAKAMDISCHSFVRMANSPRP